MMMLTLTYTFTDAYCSTRYCEMGANECGLGLGDTNNCGTRDVFFKVRHKHVLNLFTMCTQMSMLK